MWSVEDGYRIRIIVLTAENIKLKRKQDVSQVFKTSHIKQFDHQRLAIGSFDRFEHVEQWSSHRLHLVDFRQHQVVEVH